MRVLVVGGSSGIGFACLNALASNPGTVVMAPRKEELDVASDESVRNYSVHYGQHFFEGLVYSAGINYLEWHKKLDLDQMARVYNVNVIGLLRLLQSFMFNKVVVVGSDAADMPMRTSVAYNASKAALNAAVKCIARESAYSGRAYPQINVVAPGKIEDTGMTDHVEKMVEDTRGWSPDRLREYELSRITMGRYGEPSEVAEVIRWLMFDAPAYLHGEVIKVNGGR